VSFGEIIGRIKLHDLRGQEEGNSGLRAYCNSMLLAYVWLSELQARLRRAGARVDCFATQPGYVASRLMDKVSFMYPLAIPAYIGARLIALPPRLGCRSTLVRRRVNRRCVCVCLRLCLPVCSRSTFFVDIKRLVSKNNLSKLQLKMT